MQKNHVYITALKLYALVSVSKMSFRYTQPLENVKKLHYT